MPKQELYFSVDVETNGPIPGPFSMLSFGCVALAQDGCELGSFETNLEELPGASQDKDTMEFWANNQEVYEQCRKHQQKPAAVINSFVEWVDDLCGERYKPVMVCMPAGFDFMFMYWYLINFAGKSPFSFSCVDMKSYAMAMRKKPYRKCGKSYWPKRWFPKLPHTHVAIEDAREQGLTFINMMKENLDGNA